MDSDKAPEPSSGSLSGLAARANLLPGSLTHVGTRRSDTVSLELITYDGETFHEEVPQDLETCLASFDGPHVSWLHVCGLHDTDLIERIGHELQLHPLVLEDVLNTLQRPKMEDLGNYLLVELEMLSYQQADTALAHEQVSIILGPHYVLSFEESDSALFDVLRDRIRASKGRVRHLGADYLAYLMIDLVVDQYFVLLEHLGDRIEALEDEVIEQPSPDSIQRLHQIKSQLVLMRKSVWPLREAISSLERLQSTLVQSSTQPYLRDVYEHTIQVIDTVETYRDLLAGLLDLYLSTLSYRMNEIMKVLTIISTLFIPLTFVAGVYGMNFRYMPELGSPWGYPAVWLVMMILVIVMLQWFRRHRWL